MKILIEIIMIYHLSLLLVFMIHSEAKIIDGIEESSTEETLVLSHILFRHGDRTNLGLRERYPKDPYINETYYPYGLGQLTNIGKQREFLLGKALRKRYNNFLGDYYLPDIIEPISTDYNRTKMSLLLVLAGLFPPIKELMWEDENLLWQPIPYNYISIHSDKVLRGIHCPNYLQLYRKVIASPEIQEKFERHQEVFKYISKNTGLDVKTFFDVYDLYFGLLTEEHWGFELPKWTKNIWPDIITSIALQDYYISTATTDMKRMASGYFLNKVIEDTKQKIFNEESEKKLYLYSGHENNISLLLITLGLFGIPHIPTYGSYVLFEIHKIDGIYGVKIFYENYSSNGPELLKMPLCEEFCRFEKFIALVQRYIPSDDLCGI